MVLISPFKAIAAIPVRAYVGFMLFNSCMIAYMQRTTVSINILAMVHPPNSTQNGNITDYGPRYNWTAIDQSNVLGSFFWGYLATQCVGGLLSDMLGGRMLIFYSILLSAFFTALAPLAAGFGVWYFIASRVAIGLSCGILYPALHSIVAKWAPFEEKGKFVACLLGGALGTVLTWSMLGYILEIFGWDWAFYVPAIFSFIAAFAWLYFVRNTPQDHPSISKEELKYIETSLEGKLTIKHGFPPLGKVLTSIPFLALCLLHFANNWGLYFLLTATPKFMSEALGFKLSKTGILASLPSLARLFSGFFFGSLGDRIRKNKRFSITTCRKFFTIFSHIIPGLFLIGLVFIKDSPYLVVACVTLSLGINGAATLTNLQNSQDLSPNFAGSLYGIINFIGTFTGLLCPMVVAYFTYERSTFEEWVPIFVIGGSIYILPALVFMVFGSGEIQSFNEIKKNDIEITKL